MAQKAETLKEVGNRFGLVQPGLHQKVAENDAESFLRYFADGDYKEAESLYTQA